MASWVGKKTELEEYARSLDKAVRLHTKDHWTQKVICWAVLIVTFSLGRGWVKRYKNDFATTLGHLQFYPRGYTEDRVRRLIPHETGHTKEFRAYSLWIHPFLGIPALAVKYALLPLPIKLAFGRAHSELYAEKFAWTTRIEEGSITAQQIRWQATHLTNNVTGSMYLWAIPRSWCLKWYHKTAEKYIVELEFKKEYEEAFVG